MSRAHSKKFQSYSQLDNDSNNRLAMSRDLHGWFDHLNTYLPLFYLEVVSISDSIVLDDRYKVIISVKAINRQAADMIFCRLIDGSSKTDNPLEMNTFVYMKNPSIFQKCLEWKAKETNKLWDEYFSTEPAVP